MKTFFARASFVIMTTATVIMAASPVASAATLPTVPSGGQALQLAPPIITLTANPGQTIKTQMEIRDIASGPLVVSNQINDFVADGTGGTPVQKIKDSGIVPVNWICVVVEAATVPTSTGVPVALVEV